MKDRKKGKIILAGHMKWDEFRDILVTDLKSCKTEEDFLKRMNILYFSISNSEEEMQEKRRRLGIPET